MLAEMTQETTSILTTTLKLSSIASTSVNRYKSLWKTLWRCLLKPKLGMHCESEISQKCVQNTCSRIFMAALFVIAKKLGTTPNAHQP